MINAIGIALNGLDSASQRVSAAASNIANALTAGSLEAGKPQPYTPLTTTSHTQGETGGLLTQTVPRDKPFVPAYAPDSPFADSNGIIGLPNVDYAQEIVNMKLAAISYKANISVARTASAMSEELMRLLDKKV